MRTYRALQSLLLAGLGLFLLQKIWTGSLYWYINQRFLWLVLLAAITLLALARAIVPGKGTGAAPSSDAPGHDHSAGHDHPHEHTKPSGWGLVFLAVPLVLGLLVPARPLGTTAIENRGINTGAPLRLGGGAPSQLELAPADRNVLDWVRAFNYAKDPQTYAGEAADVIGFVYHAPGQAEDEFLVSRFAVTCCSADGTAVGLLVRWPGAAGLESNAWVRVRGLVEVGTFAGRTIPLIIADSLEGVEAPAQPYLYP
jgi:uncharacterized repeat protein (TIGR03943 family)